jgi:hypothetical protein
LAQRSRGGGLRVTYGAGFLPSAIDPDALLVRDRFGVVGFNVPDKSPAVIRARIEKLARWMAGFPTAEQQEFQVEHTLIEGVYTRKLLIPKGSVLIGKVHLKECVNIVAKGDISVLTESGCGRFQAGHVATSKAGIQKLGFAHEDTVFINCFRTDETDIQKIENEIACESWGSVGVERMEALCL